MTAMAKPVWPVLAGLPENLLTYVENEIAFTVVDTDRRGQQKHVADFRRRISEIESLIPANETHVAPAPSAGPVTKRARTDA